MRRATSCEVNPGLSIRIASALLIAVVAGLLAGGCDVAKRASRNSLPIVPGTSVPSDDEAATVLADYLRSHQTTAHVVACGDLSDDPGTNRCSVRDRDGTCQAYNVARTPNRRPVVTAITDVPYCDADAGLHGGWGLFAVGRCSRGREGVEVASAHGRALVMVCQRHGQWSACYRTYPTPNGAWVPLSSSSRTCLAARRAIPALLR